jgi:hypothetical protein
MPFAVKERSRPAMTRPKLLYSALLATLLTVAGLSAGPTTPAAASVSTSAQSCQGFVSDVFRSGDRIRFQGRVKCDFVADLISIEVRLIPLTGSPSVTRRRAANSNAVQLAALKRCVTGTYAGTLAADAYVGGRVVASVREATPWYDITC